MEIYQVGVGATINETTRFANITLAESDDPQGLVYFAVGYRLPIATRTTTRLSLQVYRRASTATVMSVRYRTVVSNKPNWLILTPLFDLFIGRTLCSFSFASLRCVVGHLIFHPGQYDSNHTPAEIIFFHNRNTWTMFICLCLTWFGWPDLSCASADTIFHNVVIIFSQKHDWKMTVDAWWGAFYVYSIGTLLHSSSE